MAGCDRPAYQASVVEAGDLVAEIAAAVVGDDAHVQLLAVRIGQDQVADRAAISTELLCFGGFEFQVLRGFGAA